MLFEVGIGGLVLNELRSLAAMHGIGPWGQASVSGVTVLMWAIRTRSWPAKIRIEDWEVVRGHDSAYTNLKLTVSITPRLNRKPKLGDLRLMVIDAAGRCTKAPIKPYSVQPPPYRKDGEQWRKGEQLEGDGIRRELWFQLWFDYAKGRDRICLELDAGHRKCRSNTIKLIDATDVVGAR